MPASEFLAPAALAEALEALAVEGALALGGGTALAILLKNRLVEPVRIVWLGRVAELAGVRHLQSGGIELGAATTLAGLSAQPEVAAAYPMLAAAAGGVGNVRVRAVATLGGHVAHADPRQDLPPVLLALGAELVLSSPGGERTLPAEKFFTGYLETALRPGEVVRAIRLPPARPDQRALYTRFTPGSEDDYPTVGVAAAIADGQLRIGLGGVAPTAVLVRLPGGIEPEAAAEAAAAAADPAGDQRGSAGYKRAMTRLWTRRTLAALRSI